MSNPFRSEATITTTDTPANVEAVPVAEKVDGETDKTAERTYTGADLEVIVKDRLVREQKKYAREKADLESKLQELEQSTTKKVSSNVEEDLRQKLSKYEAEVKSKDQALTEYRTETLKAKIERALNAADCLDPELVMDHFISRNLVHFDDDGKTIFVENARNSLDDLVGDYLEKKPHLKRSTSQGGAGSKGPARPAAINGPQDLSTDEMRRQLGGGQKTQNMFAKR